MDQEVSVTQSRMRKPLLIFGGYSYRIHTRKVNSIRWTCRKDRQTGCRGSLFTSVDNRVISTPVQHSCVPDIEEIEATKFYVTCLRRVSEETSVPVHKIYREEFSRIYRKGFDLVSKIPKYENVKGSLCRERRNVLRIDQNSKDDISVEFPKTLVELPNGENFLLVDHVISDTRRICIFGGMNAKKLMSRGSICLIDGTSRSCPKPFAQIFTIHVDVGSTEYETNVCPALFALLPDTQKSTYQIMLELIKELCPWSPELVKVDFEASMVAAIKCVFPHTQISGCICHFMQCLWKKILSLGLLKDYIEDKAVKQTCRKCAALAYLPLTRIQEAWMMILQSAPDNEELDDFLAYFVDEWLENSNIPPEIWNVYNQRHQTNNAVEGWNRKLNALASVKNILVFIEKLKQLVIDQDKVGSFFTTKFTRLDKSIQVILEEFGHTQDLERCLLALSLINIFE